MHIAFSRFSVFYSPLIATFAGGFLQEEGFDVTHEPVPAGKTAISMVQAGEATVAQAAVSAGFMALEKGGEVETPHFAQINEADGFFVAGREADEAFAWAKLAGRRVLVDHGGQPQAMFRYACHKMGLDYGAIDAIDAGDPAEMETAFRAGEGDFIHLQGPAPQQLAADGAAHVLASCGAASGATAFSSLIATPDWLSTNEARAFMSAYRKARAFVVEAPSAAVADAIAPLFPAIDASAVEETIIAYQALGCWSPHVEITEAAYEGALDVFEHAGLITTRHPYDKVVVSPPV
jgi:NitT/TauT family transport system substrate-binding protein